MAGNNGIAVQDLINEALSHLGVYQGDALDASDLQSAFFTFVAMMDGWTAEPLTIFQKSVLTFETIANQQSYTLGVGAPYAWQVSALPSDYDAVTQGPAGSGLELPVVMVGELEWAALPLKGLSSSILAQMYRQTLATSHTLNFWPLPAAAMPINLYVSQRIPTFTAVSNVVALPPGYQEAITFELAAKCSAKFGARVPEWLPAAMQDAKSKIKAKNFPALDMRVDSALVRRCVRLGGNLAFYEGK
jgi:hypothetical protein